MTELDRKEFKKVKTLYRWAQAAHAVCQAVTLGAAVYLSNSLECGIAFAAVPFILDWPLAMAEAKRVSKNYRDEKTPSDPQYLKFAGQVAHWSNEFGWDKPPYVSMFEYRNEFESDPIYTTGKPDIIRAQRSVLAKHTERERDLIAAHEVSHVALGTNHTGLFARVIGYATLTETVGNLALGVGSHHLSNIIAAGMVIVGANTIRKAIDLSQIRLEECTVDRCVVLATKDPETEIQSIKTVRKVKLDEIASAHQRRSELYPITTRTGRLFDKAARAFDEGRVKLYYFNRPKLIRRFAKRHNIIGLPKT